LAALLLPLQSLGAEAQPRWVPTPRGALVPISATNRPFLAADRTRLPVDIAAVGYVEEEVLVSGRSSLYEWAPGARGGVVVRGPGEAWTTRMLIRRPADAARFSGRIVLELLDAPDGHDTAPLWGLSHGYLMRSGDAWAGLTVRPAAVRTMQAFDAVRYGKLSLPRAESLECQAEPDADVGLAWDQIAQAGALLRSTSRENPLASLHPQRMLLAGHSGAGGFVVAYANAMNARWRLVGGAPVFDGYLDFSGARAQSLNPCAAALADNDPRHGVMPRDVPFVVVMTQGDLGRGALPVRRASSDSRRDAFRYFEFAAAARGGPWPAGQPAATDLFISGIEPPPAEACREPPSDYPVGYALNALLQQFDTLLLNGEPMIQTPRIETGAGGAPTIDAHGNARGGWRLPPLDVPLASYAVHGTAVEDTDAARRACAEVASMKALPPPQLRQLHRDGNGYLKRFNEAVNNAVDGRRLLPADAQALKGPAARRAPAF
jgi:hypothetical protein